jgi:fermentation-respiration switch protein FrsA (DUF1100 family)
MQPSFPSTLSPCGSSRLSPVQDAGVRGYGHSEGKPSEAGVYRDAEAAYEYLVSTKNIDPKAIVSFGQSLGTSVATHVAARRRVAGVVLQAPFPSASRVARKVFWFLPGVSFLVRG